MQQMKRAIVQILKRVAAVADLSSEVADIIEDASLQSWFIEHTSTLAEAVNSLRVERMTSTSELRRMVGEVLEAYEGMIRVAKDLEVEIIQ